MNRVIFEYQQTNDRRTLDDEILALIDEVYEKNRANHPPPVPRSLEDIKREPPLPKLTESRPRRANGELGEAILHTLFRAGRSGLGLQAIAEEIDSKPCSVSNWLYNNRNRVPGLQKRSPGIYAYKSPR